MNFEHDVNEQSINIIMRIHLLPDPIDCYLVFVCREIVLPILPSESSDDCIAWHVQKQQQ